MEKDIKIFAKTIEPSAKEQIEHFSSLGSMNGCKIRIMPDVHAGKGCTIGTTIALKDKVIPGMVGVDIGCGMLVIKIKDGYIDLSKLDDVIRTYVPSGFQVHNKVLDNFGYSLFKCASVLDDSFCDRSIGTLGGGNHFIEIDEDDDGCKYLVIHSGSRNLGVKVCKYYQNLAYSSISDNKEEVNGIISSLKKEGRERDISAVLSNLKKKSIDKEYAYLAGDNMNDYIHDMMLAQDYATSNRLAIANIIVTKMHFHDTDFMQTVHNYIDTDNMILRKGAVSANRGEKMIIPMNMRDGSLICVGKGNPDWNFSAPHGAGRLMSRKKAHEILSENEFKKEMKDIYSTSVCESTIDESPMAYKPMDEIISQIGNTVDVEKIIKPIYNFKAI